MVGTVLRRKAQGFGAVDTRLNSVRSQMSTAHSVWNFQAIFTALRFALCCASRWIALLTLNACRWLAGLAIQPQAELSLSHPCQRGRFEFVSTLPVPNAANHR